MTEAIGSDLDLVDTHAHLVDPRLAGQLDQVLARARRSGVRRVLAIGTTAEDSRDCVELTRVWPGVFAAVGIQPNHVAEASPGDWERIESLARASGVVAIGETGLDRYWDRTPFAQQVELFERHLSLGRALGLPVVIHCRESEEDVFGVLSRFGPPIAGVMHSFTGSWEHARRMLELGLHISFAGMVTFANPALEDLRRVAEQVPLERLLVETDSPYLSPVPFRGKTNEPARVVHVAALIAERRGLRLEELASITTRNALGLFDQIQEIEG